jgi:uncharacterized protein (DUF4415 family)
MTTGIEFLKLPKRRMGRGPNKKPTLVSVSLRIPHEVLDYFTTQYPYTKQAKIREALAAFVKKEKGKDK